MREPGRGPLLARAKASARRRLGRDDEQSKVLPGRDGWLFLQHDANDVLGQHTGRVRLGRRRAAAWERCLSKRAATMEELGLTWLCVIAPDKEAVYAELLPDSVVPASRRPVHDVLDAAAAAGAPVRYPLEELRAARGPLPVYYVTDTHWNQRGTYVVHRLIVDELAGRGVSVPAVREDDVEWLLEETPGDLGGKLRPPRAGRTVRAHLPQHRSRLVADNRVENHGRVMVFESDARDGPTCVAFGESFGNHLLIWLKESFRRLTYVHTNMVDRALLERERPDVVLSLPVERFLVEVPDDRDAHAKLEELARRKLAAGRIGTDRFLRGIPRETG